jgi:nucleotide-binding universal stress UspA family protein
MRILIASDGSKLAERAVRLVESLPWAAGTSFHLVVVDDGRLHPMGASGGPVPLEEYAADPGDPAEIARQAAGFLLRPGWSVDWAVEQGRAATVIVDATKAIGADLVVVGSRGRGRLGSLALGSVSAEVAGDATASVLVARGDGPFERVVLADDGSPSAARARAIVGSWPIFAASAITVTCVAHARPALAPVVVPAIAAQTTVLDAGTLEAARRHRDEVLEEAGRTLSAEGRQVELTGGEGDPATRIVDLAGDLGADLIVSGSRGLTGLDRLLLGSVARNLLYAAPCSMLIAR